MVEFALVIPIFMLVLSGILDFGLALYSRMTVINSAREGARAAVMVDPKTAASTIPGVAQQRAISAASQAGLTLTVANVVTTCVTTNPTTTSPCTWTLHSDTNPNGAQSGDSVSVTVTYRYPTFFPLAFGTHFDLTSTVQMVIE
jgi:Flp pilus assembly protein TadG